MADTEAVLFLHNQVTHTHNIKLPPYRVTEVVAKQLLVLVKYITSEGNKPESGETA